MKNYMVKTDCEMYNPTARNCSGLNRLYCKTENCKFYKKENGNGKREKERKQRRA